MATQSTTPASSSSNISPPPPPPVKESVGRRYKFIWPLLLAVNFSIGAYLFTRTNKEEEEKTEGEVREATSTPTSTAISTASLSQTSTPPPTIPEPVKSIPVDQQRELFKWILEEKRKVRTKDPEEKRRIDEEKAILKQFIRAKSIPSL